MSLRLEAVVVRRGERTLLAVDLGLDAPLTAIVGPSGAGKTTLLRLLNQLDSPSEGRVLLGGRDLAALDPIAVRRRVGFVAQQPPSLAPTVREELALAAALSGRSDAEGPALLAALDLGEKLEQASSELSVGERQRMAIARALVAGPEILVLDEPTSAQDEVRAGLVHALLAARIEAGLRVVIVEHDRALLERHRRAR